MSRSGPLRAAALLLTAASSWGCGGAASSGGPGAPGAGLAVEIAPPSARTAALGTVAFRATVSGTSNTSVLWSVAEAGGGTVTAAGHYTAPPASGVFHVVATSAADGSRSARAAVTVTTSPPPSGPLPIPLLARVDGYDGSPAGAGPRALDLGAARQAVLLAWQLDGNAYDASVRGWGYPGSVPGVYAIETAPSASGPWTARVRCSSTPRTSATQNALTSRQHVFSAQGDRFLRMQIATGETALTRLDVFDAQEGTDDDFVVFGDSITEFAAEVGVATSIADRVALLTGNAHRPFVQKAGISYDKFAGSAPGSFDTDARQRLADYLGLFPGKFVGLAYGTNDSVNDQTEIAEYRAAIRACLDRILAAGKVPVVATLPWSSVQTTTADRNRYLAEVLAEPAYAGRWLAGPDLYAFFSQLANRHFLTDNDGLHPSPAGLDEWRRLWAEAIVRSVYGP